MFCFLQLYIPNKLYSVCPTIYEPFMNYIYLEDELHSVLHSEIHDSVLRYLVQSALHETILLQHLFHTNYFRHILLFTRKKRFTKREHFWPILNMLFCSVNSKARNSYYNM